MHNKKKFILNIWVHGYIEDKEIFGRTCIFNNQEMVVIINSDAIPSLVPFNIIENVGKIREIKKPSTKPDTIKYESVPNKKLTEMLLSDNISN